MNDPGFQIPAFYDAVTSDEIAASDLTESERPLDTNGDTLSFTQLGGFRFEILAYHLLSGDPLNPKTKVVLVKSSGDQGRDVLVYTGGSLQTIVQCKNLSTALTKPQILRELVKLVLNDIKTPFIPEKGVNYEIWAPGGLFEPAEQLLAGWPEQLLDEDVRTAFDTVTTDYEKLKHLTWEESNERLLLTLRAKIKPWRQLNLDLARRVRNYPDLSLAKISSVRVLSDS
jgi:hypothetical protein